MASASFSGRKCAYRVSIRFSNPPFPLGTRTMTSYGTSIHRPVPAWLCSSPIGTDARLGFLLRIGSRSRIRSRTMPNGIRSKRMSIPTTMARKVDEARIHPMREGGGTEGMVGS